MKRFLLLSGCLGVLSGFSLSAQSITGNDGEPGWVNETASLRPSSRASKPQLDPKRIINESSSFLKEREPEMSAEEYALYEKVVTMLATKPLFALKLLEAMMDEKETPSPAFSFILGNAYYAADEPAKSEASYRQAVERYPTFLRAWNNLGVLYYTTDRYQDAGRCFAKAVALGDRDPTTYGLLGYSLEKQDNLIAAEVAYMQALAGQPENGDWKEGLLRICIQGKQLARAESIVRHLIAEQPQEGRFWLVHANILLSGGRKLEAITVLEAAAGLGVGGLDELALLGDLYAEHGLSAEATAIYQKILGTSVPNGADRLLRFAQMLIYQEELPGAEKALRALPAELPPALRRTLLQTEADLFAARKDWPAARERLDLLLKMAPLDGRALLSLGHAFSEEKNLDRAALAFAAAYTVPESTYRASLELANLQLKRRDYREAVKYLEHALSIQRTDAVEAYLARIKTLVVPDDPTQS